jgi:hypothetical protein
MAIFHNSKNTFLVDADDAHSLDCDLARAVEIAELEARHAGNAGVLITQHDYWSYTVSVSQEVTSGHKVEQRRWLASF